MSEFVKVISDFDSYGIEKVKFINTEGEDVTSKFKAIFHEVTNGYVGPPVVIDANINEMKADYLALQEKYFDLQAKFILETLKNLTKDPTEVPDEH